MLCSFKSPHIGPTNSLRVLKALEHCIAGLRSDVRWYALWDEQCEEDDLREQSEAQSKAVSPS